MRSGASADYSGIARDCPRNENRGMCYARLIVGSPDQPAPSQCQSTSRSEPHTAPSTLAHAASACANVLSRVSNPRCRVWLRSKRCRSCRPGESSIHKISSPMRRSCGIIVFAIGKRPSCTRSKHCSTRTRNRVVGSEGCEQRGIGRWASGSVSVLHKRLLEQKEVSLLLRIGLFRSLSVFCLRC